jgi:cobalt-zinc-cadmium efflux system protein
VGVVSHDHDHGGFAAGRAGARHRQALVLAFVLLLAYFVVQTVAALATGSLALLSDAGHMLTDVGGIGMALAAITLASRPGPAARTFGLYRLEVLAALANAVLLFGVAGYVLVEAIRRIGDPPDVASGVLFVVGTIGLAVNVVAFFLLRRGASESLNVEGAYLEVAADAAGSLGAIVAAVVMSATGWQWVDPVVGAGIGLVILPRAARLAGKALRVLVEAAPAHLDVEAMAADLAALDGVIDVHDVHVWTLTSEMEAASAHVMVSVGTDTHRVLDQARAVLQERHHVVHATLQVEPEDHTGCEEVGW